VSQSYFALHASLLFIKQTRDATGFEEQLYARAIPSRLWLLRRCAQMEANELRSETEVQGLAVTLSQASPVAVSEAICPAGDIVVSGGWNGLGTYTTVGNSVPVTVNGDQGWEVRALLDQNATGSATLTAIAMCAS
jgi:hypothetical protein